MVCFFINDIEKCVNTLKAGDAFTRRVQLYRGATCKMQVTRLCVNGQREKTYMV